MPEHPQTSFCKADFVVRVKVLGKIKRDDEVPTTEASAGDKFTVPSPTERLVADTDAPETKSASTRRFQKIDDLPPQSNNSDAGSLLGLIFARHKRNIGIRGAPAPGGKMRYRPIGGKGRDKGMMYYDVLIKKIFKGEDRVRRTKRTFVDASNPSRLFARIYFSSHHGQDLVLGDAYMLSGKIMDNELILPSRGCWMQKWRDLSKDQIHGLNKVYAENCECMVQFCFPGRCASMPKSQLQCNWKLQNFREPRRDCGARHNACVNTRGQCQWKIGKEYDSCINPSGILP